MIHGLKQDIVDAIVICLEKNPKIEEAILYGSRAKGNFNTGSDIDIALKGDQLTRKDIYSLADQLEELMTPYKFDISIYHQINNKDLLDHINRVGIIIFQQENQY